MDYWRARKKIENAIGYNFDFNTMRNNEQLVGFFIANKQRDFFLQIYQTSANVYEFSVCNACTRFPYMTKLSFNSLKELSERMKDYKDYFTHVSE